MCDNAVGKDTAIITGLVPTVFLFIIVVVLIVLIIIIFREGVKIINKATPPDERTRTDSDDQKEDIVTEFCKGSMVGKYLYAPVIRRLKTRSNSQS